MRIAIVTGASSGMGRESVIQLADRFAALDEIWVIARRKERLLTLAEDVPVKLRCFDADLMSEEGISALKQALSENRPRVKVLVNGAGFGKMGNIGQVPLEFETGMVALNCQALCAVTNLVLPYLTDRSRIIQFASSAAFLPQPGFAIYAATKSFVLSYSRSLNEELIGRGICVTAVCPGPVATEFFHVAETTGKMPLYKLLFLADSKKVVRKAIQDSMMGKTLSIYGFTMKSFYVLSKLLPHRFLVNLISYFNH